MIRLRLLLVALSIGVVVVACGQNSQLPVAAPSPVSNPAALSAASGLGSPSTPSSIQHPIEDLVNMLDACDPDTFNAQLGPGSCLRPGGLSFQSFINLLGGNHVVEAWRFTPNTFTVQAADTTLVAVNKGGETHTFTRVENFGGGIVPVLNTLSNNPVEAPECKALEGDDFVAPGGTYRQQAPTSGTAKFQCCIHPWMRLETRGMGR